MEPTSPLRSIHTIRKVANLFKKNKKINSIIPVTIKNNLIAFKYKKNIKFLNNKNINNSIKRSEYYEVNSLIWGVRTNYFLKTKKIFDEKSFIFITKKSENFDLNSKKNFFILKKKI